MLICFISRATYWRVAVASVVREVLLVLEILEVQLCVSCWLYYLIQLLVVMLIARVAAVSVDCPRFNERRSVISAWVFCWWSDVSCSDAAVFCCSQALTAQYSDKKAAYDSVATGLESNRSKLEMVWYCCYQCFLFAFCNCFMLSFWVFLRLGPSVYFQVMLLVLHKICHLELQPGQWWWWWY